MNVGDEIVFNDDGVRRPGHIQGIDGEDVLVVLASRKGTRRVWREQVTVVATARRDALARLIAAQTGMSMSPAYAEADQRLGGGLAE